MGFLDKLKGGGKETSSPQKDVVPVDRVISLKTQGLNNQQIISQLKAEGVPLEKIRDAVYQADIKQGVMSTPEAPLQPINLKQPTAPQPQMPAPMQTPVPVEETEPSGLPELPPLPELPEAPGAKPTEAEGVPKQPTAPAAGYTSGTGESMDMGQEMDIESLIETVVEEKYRAWDSRLRKAMERIESVHDEMVGFKAKIDNMKKDLDDFKTDVMSRDKSFQQKTEGMDVELDAFKKVMETLVPPLTEGIRDLKESLATVKKEKTPEKPKRRTSRTKRRK